MNAYSSIKVDNEFSIDKADIVEAKLCYSDAKINFLKRSEFADAHKKLLTVVFELILKMKLLNDHSHLCD